MFGGDYDCRQCKRPGCLKNSQIVRLKNIPQKCPLYDRAVLLNKSNIWFYYDILKIHIPGDKTVISYINAFLGVCPKSILGHSVYEILNRYFHCKNFNVQPFGGSYDEQPQEWLFFASVIQDELNKKEIEDLRSQTKPK